MSVIVAQTDFAPADGQYERNMRQQDAVGGRVRMLVVVDVRFRYRINCEASLFL